MGCSKRKKTAAETAAEKAAETTAEWATTMEENNPSSVCETSSGAAGHAESNGGDRCAGEDRLYESSWMKKC